LEACRRHASLLYAAPELYGALRATLGEAADAIAQARPVLARIEA
jgi:hypothetical protein